jgi:hypothetical protein
LPAFDRHVHVSPLFATFAADWNPFGTALWFFLGFGVLAALLVSHLSPLPVRIQHCILFTLPALMVLGCLFTRWINSRSAFFLEKWYFYKFYYAELDAAFVVSVAFGAAFTLDAVRSGNRACRVIGWWFSLVYAALLAATFWYINGGCGLFEE